MSTEVLLKEFAEVAEHPHRVLTGYKNEGKKVIGILPYFARYSYSSFKIHVPGILAQRKDL